MKLQLKDKIIEFEMTEITISKFNIENIFDNNNRPIKNFERSLSSIKKPYPKKVINHFIGNNRNLDCTLGEYILKLKNEGNEDYKLFLNRYGDNKFCIFQINSNLTDKGIYCYVVDNEIKYIGRSKNNFANRINNNYGKITPYKCLLRGQSTNCHINSLINEINNVTIGIYKMNDKTSSEIEFLEKQILSEHNFKWNIQKF